MIQAIGLTSVPRRHQPPAVDDLTFEACPGEITVLWGPAGAGKTTALRLLLHLSPGRGVGLFRGRPLPRIPHPLQEVGVLLGDVPGHPARTARNHLRMLSAAVGVPVDRVDDLLDTVGLADVADHRLGGFSLGMSRRLALAVALLGDPHTLVLDEPTRGLSPREVSWLERLLGAYAAGGGTVLVATGDVSVARELADRVVTVEAGRLLADEGVTDFVRGRHQPRVTVHSPQADRLAALLSHQARVSSRPGNSVPLRVVPEGGGRIAVYGSTCATVGETAHRHGILVHQLTAETDRGEPGVAADGPGSELAGWTDPALVGDVTGEPSVDSPGPGPTSPSLVGGASGLSTPGGERQGDSRRGSGIVPSAGATRAGARFERGALTVGHQVGSARGERMPESMASQEARSTPNGWAAKVATAGAGAGAALHTGGGGPEAGRVPAAHGVQEADGPGAATDIVGAGSGAGEPRGMASLSYCGEADTTGGGERPDKPGARPGAGAEDVGTGVPGGEPEPGGGGGEGTDTARLEDPAADPFVDRASEAAHPDREGRVVPGGGGAEPGAPVAEPPSAEEGGRNEGEARRFGSLTLARAEAGEVAEDPPPEPGPLPGACGDGEENHSARPSGPTDQADPSDQPGLAGRPGHDASGGSVPVSVPLAARAPAGADRPGSDAAPAVGDLLCTSAGSLVIRTVSATPAEELADNSPATSFRIPEVRPPGPNRPLRYELLRFATLRSSWLTPLFALLAGVGTAVVLARSGGTGADRLLSGWPVSLPLPPVALAAGALGAVAFGQEFRYPALAPARAAFPRRLGLLVAKLTLSGVLAVALVLVTVVANASVGMLLTGDRTEVLHPPSGMVASVVGLAVLCLCCAWAGLLAAGMFRSTAAGLIAVVAVPMAGAPALWGLLSEAPAAGAPAWLWANVLASWPSELGPGWSGVREFSGQPVGCAVLLSLIALLACSTCVARRSRMR